MSACRHTTVTVNYAKGQDDSTGVRAAALTLGANIGSDGSDRTTKP